MIHCQYNAKISLSLIVISLSYKRLFTPTVNLTVAKSQYLSPIEHLWDELGRRVREGYNVDRLLGRCWSKVFFKNGVPSLSKRSGILSGRCGHDYKPVFEAMEVTPNIDFWNNQYLHTIGISFFVGCIK